MNIGKLAEEKEGKFAIFWKKDETSKVGAQDKVRKEKEGVGSPILPNSDSLTFLVQIPHMYVYTMAYYDT